MCPATTRREAHPVTPRHCRPQGRGGSEQGCCSGAAGGGEERLSGAVSLGGAGRESMGTSWAAHHASLVQQYLLSSAVCGTIRGTCSCHWGDREGDTCLTTPERERCWRKRKSGERCEGQGGSGWVRAVWAKGRFPEPLPGMPASGSRWWGTWLSLLISPQGPLS